MYNEINKINIDELRRARIIKGEALAFISQFRVKGEYIHCILKQEPLKRTIKKEIPDLDIPKNIIKERRLSLFGTIQNGDDEDFENFSFELIQEERKNYGNKGCSDLDIPKNIIQERRASLIESVKNNSSTNNKKSPVGKIKRFTYLSFE